MSEPNALDGQGRHREVILDPHGFVTKLRFAYSKERGFHIPGQRVPDEAWWDEARSNGDYGRVMVGGKWRWLAILPDHQEIGLGAHSVTEHADGTITVAPSIVGRKWHGKLEAGVWTDA